MFPLPLFVSRIATAVRQRLWQGSGPVLCVLLKLTQIVLGVQLCGWGLAWLGYGYNRLYVPALLREFQTLAPLEQALMIAQFEGLPAPAFWSGLRFTLPLMLLILFLRLPFLLPPRGYPARPAPPFDDDYSAARYPSQGQ